MSPGEGSARPHGESLGSRVSEMIAGATPIRPRSMRTCCAAQTTMSRMRPSGRVPRARDRRSPRPPAQVIPRSPEGWPRFGSQTVWTRTGHHRQPRRRSGTSRRTSHPCGPTLNTRAVGSAAARRNPSSQLLNKARRQRIPIVERRVQRQAGDINRRNMVTRVSMSVERAG